VNELLRTVCRKIIRMNFRKTHIGRIIFGSGNYPMFLRFIDSDKQLNFGIKPLMRAADVLGYEVRLVLIDPEKNDPITDVILEKNKIFAIELEDYLVTCLSNMSEEKRSRKSTLDEAIDSFIEKNIP